MNREITQDFLLENFGEAFLGIFHRIIYGGNPT